MFLEQEAASIIGYILAAAGGDIHPYYYNVPEKYAVPSCYFPVPEVNSYGDTFTTYALDYSWGINFFHNKTQDAYPYAIRTLEAIRRERNLIPLVNKDGSEAGTGLRINDPVIKVVDEGAIQLFISWRSHRPYKDDVALKMIKHYLIFNSKQSGNMSS